jgi:hypothetical protein
VLKFPHFQQLIKQLDVINSHSNMYSTVHCRANVVLSIRKAMYIVLRRSTNVYSILYVGSVGSNDIYIGPLDCDDI